MSGAEKIKLSSQDIQYVQNHVERCLKRYMNRKEVINYLIVQENIQAGFTELVWQRLEEENPDFFKAYYLKLLVKDQILEFNRLISEQVNLMHRIGLTGIAPVLTSNGSHVSPTQQISTSCAPQNTRTLKVEDMQLSNVFNHCGPSIQPNGSGHCRKIDVSPSLFLPQNPNMGLAHNMNGKIVKTEGGYAGSSSSPFHFSPTSTFLEPRPLMGDASVPSFSVVESDHPQHLNGTLLDGNASSFGFLPQIPQSFNLPELPVDFTTSSDLLESYCRPPFVATNSNNFVDPHGDIERLDPASESLRYQCFGGD
ncbi:hypothetical protein ACJIZ3_017669 [Penstemon smallii]|uniref:Angiotensin-converting enzyme 2 n=1 Tax=Penstemon smallii TaxID=265156 RepID=A0ABD3SW88_9LAMI